jgi:uncharacterized protein YraI
MDESGCVAPSSRGGRRLSKMRRTATMAVFATSLLILLPAAAAQAVGGFHTSFSSVRVRAGASTQTAQVSAVTAAGTAIDIACQIMGERITAVGGTSAVWDKLNGYANGYISDLFVRETLYARLDPRLPVCNGAPSGPVASTREAKALSWANGELGHYTDDWGRPTTNWCARWSVGAYGRMNSGYASAWTMYGAFRSLGLTHTGAAPAGTFVFFQAAKVNGWAGHVAISDGAGGMITSSPSYIRHTALSYAGAPYVGWSYAPSGWTR